jgi:hypothetical protein
MGRDISLKMQSLHSQLDFFPLNLGKVNDDHDETFHLDVSVMENSYQGIENPTMLADCCWQLEREAIGTQEEIKCKEKILRATEFLFPDLEIVAHNP